MDGRRTRAREVASRVMPTVTLRKSGLELSRIGLGLSRLHYMPSIERYKMMATAQELGITHLDTAPLYGDGFSERALGQMLAKGPFQRHMFTVATKVGLMPNRLIGYAGPAAIMFRAARSVLRRTGLSIGPRKSFNTVEIENSIAASLRSLRTDYIDILLLHEPRMAEMENSDEVFELLRSVRTKGLTRTIGIAGQIREAMPFMSKYGSLVDIVQAPASDPDIAELGPDVIYGALGAGVQIYGSAKLNSGDVKNNFKAALIQSTSGCVLVGTTRVAHLRELAALAAESSTS